MSERRLKQGAGEWTPPIVSLPNARALSSGKRRKRAPLELIALIKAHPEVFSRLLAMDLSLPGGRPRMAGCWPLVLFCFVAAKGAELKAFYDAQEWVFWKAYGFEQVPSYETFYVRMRELEMQHLEFRECARLLLMQAKRHISEIGTRVVIDCTEAGVYSVLHYWGANLNGLVGAERDKAIREGRRRRRNLEQLSAPAARKARQADSQAMDPDEPPPVPLPGDPRRHAAGDVSHVRYEEEELASGRVRTWVYLLLGAEDTKAGPRGGHWYRFLDTSAGARFHRKGAGADRKFWLGFYHLKVTDITTGAVLLCLVECASVNEFRIWLEHLDDVVAHLGEPPKIVAADKGFCVKDIFAAHTDRLIGSAIAINEPSQYIPANHHDSHDQFGVPTCRECGAPCHLVDFQHEPYPHWRYECSINAEGKCGGRKRLSVKHDRRHLSGPVHRTDLVWFEAQAALSNPENVHHLWRKDYDLGGDDRNTVPRRLGQAWQQLLCDVAAAIEWLRVCDLNGWLSSARQRGRPTRTRRELIRPYLAQAMKNQQKMWAKWLKADLDVPRGRHVRGAPPGADPPASS